MSTNSTTLFSVEDDGSLLETPISSQQKCTRGSPCSKSDCLVCNGPVTNNHVRNLTEDLEDFNLHSRPKKHTAPADHWISNLTDAFKVAIMDHDITDMKRLGLLYKKAHQDSTDHFRFNHAELNKTSITASQIIAAYNQTPDPVQTPPPPKPSCSMKSTS